MIILDKATSNIDKKTAKEIEEGKSFWESLWQRFMEREIERDTIKTILKRYYIESGNSYKKMIKKLNIDKKDYKKFLDFMRNYRIM